ncbi:SusC/RagA family TonB-linked outer membrane protein [Chitinophaga nivalis]|uniref:TonB-dependent receptor n=1 Tax=Chitinophaga nivalis TaxID=2991709 RepID=A0ABT3IUJ1_9BACT|nr:TonB-dependent receptor [Chitinophaga nivalis]MCW3462714.1 TonB-dependent receptor [Chitinophaga nivalis]MCW3487595.1 TonB-dependent receptor [Chitinophaga nivalis]
MRKVLFLLLSVLLLGGQVFAQSRTVTGKVTDAGDGTAIPGANIQIKGTTKGVTTNPDGTFSVQVADNATLLVSFIGYDAKEVAVGTNATLNIKLKVDSKNLEEVIVTGYTIEKKKSSTIAASTVSGAKINNVALPDVNQMLQGNAPGISVSTNSGQPGAKTEVRVRGVGSISASNAPIYVLDGIIMSSGDFTQNTPTQDVISSLNPADIENITILKDAAATALYGSRGSNGVIVITTKSGKKGQSKINFSGKYGFQNLAKKIPMMNSRELLDYQRLAMRNAIDPGTGTPVFTEQDVKNARPDYLANYDTDWGKEAFRTGRTQNYAISGSGGNEKTQFYASGEYFKQEGILIGSSFSRYAGRLNVDHKFSDKLDLSAKMSGSYSDQYNANNGATYTSPLLGAMSNVPFIPARDANGDIYNGYLPGQPGMDDWAPLSSIPRTLRPVLTGGNFLHAVENNYGRNNNTTMNMNLALGYNIIEGLRLVVKGNAELTNIREKQWRGPNTYDGRIYNGLLQNYSTNFGLYTTQQLLTYTTTFNKDHGLSVLVGNEYSFQNRVYSGAAKKGFSDNSLQVPSVGANMQSIIGNEYSYAFHGMLAKVDYDYKSKYFVSGSFRRDGSSRFPKDSRYGNFYSGALAWRVTEEEFAKSITWLNDLKVRTSYGIMGNAEGLGDYPFAQLYGFTGTYNDEPAPVAIQPANPRLSWEKQNLFDVGVDFSVFGRRLYGSLGFYDKRSSALLMELPLSMTTGFPTINYNVGRMMNQGFEIAIGGIPVKTKDFQWTTDLNFATLKNKVLALGEGQQFISQKRQRIEVGREFGTWYMPIWAGVDPIDGAAMWETADGKTTKNYAEAPRKYAGSALPKITGGFTNKLTYKDFDLSLLITFSWGNKAYNVSRIDLESDGLNTAGNVAKDAMKDRWQQKGDIASKPKLMWNVDTQSESLSSRWLEDVSYARIRNLTVGYTLPKNALERVKMQQVRVFLQAENLFTLTSYKGWDPDINTNPIAPTAVTSPGNNGGDDFFRYPTSRIFTIGVNVGF